MKLILELIIGPATIYYGRLTLMYYIGLSDDTATFFALGLGFLVMKGIDACFADKDKKK